MPDWKVAIREWLASADLDPLLETEIVEELAQHLEERHEELGRSGITPEECRRRVLEEIKDRDSLIRTAPGTRKPASPAAEIGIPATRKGYFRGVLHDLRVGCRNLRTRPFFSFTVIGMLALGIAGNAAIFSIFDGLFLGPLPFAESQRLVDLDETAPKWDLPYVGISSVDLDEWRRANATFDSMAFFRGANYNVSNRDTAQRIAGAQVTREILDVFRLRPLIGRNFSREEDRAGGAKVVLLSYRLWRRMFLGDRDVLGKILKLDDDPYTIIGVLFRNALFPDRAELWTPLQADPTHNSGYYVSGVGRLKGGVTIEQARADLFRVHKGMISEGHKINEITSPIVVPLRDRVLAIGLLANVVPALRAAQIDPMRALRFE